MSRQTDPHIATLLRNERARRGPSNATRARVRERVNASIVLPLLPPHAPPQVAPLVHPAGILAGTVGTVARAVALVASIAAAGTGLGYVTRPQATDTRAVAQAVISKPILQARRAQNEVTIPPIESTPSPLVVPSAPLSPVEVLPSMMSVAASTPPAHLAASPRTSSINAAHANAVPSSAAANTWSAETLAAERALLEQARSDLRAHDIPGALRDLDAHARRFPRGVLAEERDAMKVEALVAAGKGDDARAAGARFRAAHPSSLLEPTVDDALESIP